MTDRPSELIPAVDEPLPQGKHKGDAVQALFDTIAPRYDMVNRLMTFRLDVRWRRIALESLALDGEETVLDLATGTGDFCRELAERGHTAIGADFSLGMLRSARTDQPLIQADALSLPLPASSVDAATCGFALRNFIDLASFFDELGRVVRPGGRIALVDASEPDNKLARFGHGIYFKRVVPFIGGLFSNKEAYAYLPRSLEYLPERSVMLDMLTSAGFESVEHRQLTLGAAQLITATRGSASAAQ